MMRKPIILLLFVLSTTIAMLIIMVSADNKESVFNGFQRFNLNSNLSLEKKAPTSMQFLDICGATKSAVYLSGKYPSSLVALSYDLKEIDRFPIHLPINNSDLGAFKFIIDSPNISLYVNNLAIAIKYKKGDTQASVVKLQTPLFTRIAKLSRNAIALRSFDSTGKLQLLEKICSQTGKLELQQNIDKNQKDAGFSTDGMLAFDDSSSLLIYLQYYDNKFYCLDSNLNIIYTAHTIDTTNTNPVNTRNFSDNSLGNGSIMSTVPLKIINKDCCANNGRLFVLSALKADNETIDQFRTVSVIDMYSLSHGKYMGSLYIPDVEGEKPVTFRIVDDILFIITEKFVVKFKMHLA